MITLEHSAELKLLFRRYNSALQDLNMLERAVDNHAIPYCVRELKITELQKLSNKATAILEEIKRQGYFPNDSEITNGING